MSDSFQFSDPAIRLVRESDAEQIAKLFRLNYGNDYPHTDVFDGTWVKRCIYNDTNIGVVFEDQGAVVATGAVRLDYGDYNDQIGELTRLVVHPDHARHGIGTHVINALFEAAAANLEFSLGECRTSHSFSQRAFEEAGFAPIGFIPHLYFLGKVWENGVLYGKVYDTGRLLRSEARPSLISEVAPIARTALTGLGFTADFTVVNNAGSYPRDTLFFTRMVNRLSVATLAKIEYGGVLDPLLFGPVSLDQGYSLLNRRHVNYLSAHDENGLPLGGLGYQHDSRSQIVKGVQIIGKGDELRGHLCESLLKTGVSLGARIIEANVSAYNPRLQKTLLELGFRPVAYSPAMVFHRTERLDVVKMLKLNVPYQKPEMKLTERASEVVSMVEREFV